MKRLSLTNKTKYIISEQEELSIRKALEQTTRYIVIQGDTIMVNSIVAIQDEAIFEEAEHERNREFKCQHGFWHAFGSRCYGHDGFEVAARQKEEQRKLGSQTRGIDEVSANF